MQLRMDGSEWHRTLRKVVLNPAIEVAAAIVVVLLAAWVVVDAEVQQRLPQVPVMSGAR